MSQVGIDSHVGRIEEAGYTILEGVLTPTEADALRTELERLEKRLAVVPSPNSFEGAKTVRVYNLLAHGKAFEAVPVHESVLAVVERVLDEGCLVSSLSSIGILPGEKAQPIHADDQVIPVPKPHPAFVCNSMWALTDFTEQNGATRIVPGSHKAASSPDYSSQHESIPAEMSKGSVMVYHGSLWHGGGANRSNARRTGIAMNYCAGYIRQQENQQLGLDPAKVREFSPRLQELVGYGIYNGLIGHVEKQTPQQRLCSSSGESRMIWDRI